MSDPLARLRRLEQLRTEVETEIRAVRNGLLMADVDPDTGTALVVVKGRGGRRPLPSPFTYTEREARAAHALHAAGEDSDWVRHGERAYQRAKKRNERGREAS
jgi:hypothetical protein